MPHAYFGQVHYQTSNAKKPKAKAPQDPTAPWFYAVLVGRNVIAEMTKKISVVGKLEKHFTKHSLRVYGVTKLYNSNVPKKVIMERSGHCSMEGLRKYEWTNILQDVQACRALKSGHNKPASSTSVEHNISSEGPSEPKKDV